jgi:selenocysteine-specific elongation factor
MIIGTAGHIDHGKTALVRALTGIDTDRLKEEKARGISIELGFAYLPAPDGAILGFVDVPGHEKFVHHMLAGATGIDFVLLVVAADDGVMPQTREHMAIVDLLGIRHGVVALTKCDLVSAERRLEVAEDIAALLAPTRLAGADVIDVSAVTGEGIDRLRQHLFAAARTVTARATDGRFRLSVDRSFTLRGTGTVVTGTVLSGRVAVGDHVVVSPAGREARVRSIHAQNRAANEGVAGQRCALNLAGDGIAKDEIARGDMVLDPSLHAPADRIDSVFRLLPSETKPLVLWTPVRLHHAAAEVAARIVPLSEDVVAPGAEGFVQLVLERPIPAAAGDHFVLRDTTAQRTLGGGSFVDLRAPGRKRRMPERLAQLQACALGDPADALAALLARPPFFVDLVAFMRDRALASAQAGGMVVRLGLVTEAAAGNEFALAKPAWERFGASVTAALEAAHRNNPGLKGVGIEWLRPRVVPLLPRAAFLPFLQRLAKGGSVVLDGAAVRLARHEASLAPEEEKIWARVLPLLSGAERFRPPRVVEIAAALLLREADVRRLLKSLAKMTKVDEIAPDHFFLRATVAEMVDVVADLSAKGTNGQFAAADFRDRLDNGRKVAIQILEFFDRHSVTVRRGDLRRLNETRRDLYRRGAGAPAAA